MYVIKTLVGWLQMVDEMCVCSTVCLLYTLRVAAAAADHIDNMTSISLMADSGYVR